MDLFPDHHQSYLALYLVDNYGVNAADAFFEWRARGADFEGAAKDVIRRFGRIPLNQMPITDSREDQSSVQPSN